MNKIVYITLFIALLTTILTICCGCPNGVGIGGGGANYETQGVYYKGELMTGVQDAGFQSMAGLKNWRNNDDIQAAWERHKGSAKNMPRKFVLEIYPSKGSWMPTDIVYTVNVPSVAICTVLKDKEVGDKIIGQVEVILDDGNGGYIIWDVHRPGTYIPTKY